MNKNQNIYNRLILKLNDESFKNASDISDLLRTQGKNKELINQKIGQILLKHNINNGIMKLSKSEMNEIYAEFSKEINKIFNDEIKQETEAIKNKLMTVGAEKYNLNDYVYSMGINYKLLPVPVSTLNNIINKKVDGKLWSSRIWRNKNNTSKLLKSEIKDFLTGKTNVNDIDRIITNRFNVNKFNSNRLVRTEICRVQSESNNIWCEDHNIKYVMFMATLDSKTSSICQEYDGKKFEFNKSIPTPPLHPFCRSCIINLVDKEWKPQQRTDNETKEKIDYKTFKEWESEKTAHINNSSNNSKNLDNVITGLKNLNVTNYNSRKELGKDILNTLGLNNIPVEVMKVKDYGYCRITDNNEVVQYVLNKGDMRSKEYQIKTAFHESYHAKANFMNSDRLSNTKKWLDIEETFAESSAHFMNKQMGIDKELAPSYAGKIVEMLPRLKQLDKFKNCTTISDFGKIAWEDRLNGVEPVWSKLYDNCMNVKHDWKEYSKNYFKYINSNKEELIDKMLENMPLYKQYKVDMMMDIDGAIENITYNNSLTSNQDLVFKNILAITMNRKGVI